MRHCAVHCNQIRVVFYSWEGALDVIVACVTIVRRVGDGEVPHPDAEILEGVGEMECRFVNFTGPVVYRMHSWPWPEATVGNWARFTSVM